MTKGNGKAKPCIIDLYGEIHLCNPNNRINAHEELAEKLNPNSRDGYAAIELIEKGYIFAGSNFSSPYSGQEPNQSQIDTLFELEIRYITDFFHIYNTCWCVY